MNINKEQSVKVYAALPVLNENDNLPYIFNNLLEQEDVEVELIICVNQPDEWWNDPERKIICDHNSKSIEYINSLKEQRITLIDKSSRASGWIGKKHGVGWARKTAMDIASDKASDNELIISVDADTWYPTDYFKCVSEAFMQNPDAVGFSAPYYHPLTPDPVANRCILRYEIYMRNYALNMMLIQNPYAFSAIGSGMATTNKMYKKVRGLTPKLSGEDFYFIQKLRKSGGIIIDCDATIYPASRFSNRVYFGTGPAMIKGRNGNWDSYPVYPQDHFLDVKSTFDSFDDLYTQEIETPMDGFLKVAFPEINGDLKKLWEPLRKNCSGKNQFIKAASHKIDALRILQFLKQSEKYVSTSNEMRLVDFLKRNFEVDDKMDGILSQLISSGFDNIPLSEFNIIRDFMTVNERKLQRKLIVA
ncbi:MAG TPA: glycosyltransferase family A protein [Lentimicrobium sp.]|nr:glycosyltransferase family A protein [Lentimicrobium sp.]